MTHLDYSKSIVVRADASVIGGGVELSNRWIEDGETITRVVAVASHAFTAAESRWMTIEQECFILVFAVMHFRPLLLGQPFLLETDHRLMYIHGETSPKVVRWSLALQNFRFTVKHVPGESQYVTDTLSRAPAGLTVGAPLRLLGHHPESPSASRCYGGGF